MEFYLQYLHMGNQHRSPTRLDPDDERARSLGDLGGLVGVLYSARIYLERSVTSRLTIQIGTRLAQTVAQGFW
jgi:hypothetical protein